MTYDTINDARTIGGGSNSALGRIDQYELVHELGGGGFGTVYLAKDTVAGIEVAVKGLPPIIRNNADELERIRENFALVSRLHHPYIAAALHLQLARDVRYSDEAVREKLRVMPGDTVMVMEYAPGITLSKWRRQFPGRKVPLEQAVQLVWQIAQALDYAHEQHILHRDVKPSNIIVETKPDGEVVARLLDFGLAAEIRSSMGRVSREIRDTSGTRPYMAPEQWEGRKQGSATDQYALAVLLCELLTGEVPFASVFETGDPMVMMTAVCSRDVELPAGCPRQAALRRALAKEPARRFSSCMEFVEEAAKSERAAPRANGAKMGRGRIDKPVATWVIVWAIALAAIAFVGSVCWYYHHRQKQVENARRQARIAAIQQEKEEQERKAEIERKARMQEEEARKQREREMEEKCLAAERKAKDSATEIRAEAKDQHGRVTRISDADGFATRKVSLENVFARAEELYKDEKSKRWSAAEELYRSYIEQSKVLIVLDDERRQAVAKKSAVQVSYRKAEAGGAKEYARDSWNAAVKTWSAADAEFRRMEFRAAAETFAKALQEFDGCENEVQSNKRIAEEKRVEERRLAKEREAEQRRKEDATRQFINACNYKQYDTAVKLLASVNRDDANVQCCLGTMYYNGNGVLKSYTEAFKWYEKSAKQGNAVAQLKLANMYAQAQGVKRNTDLAIHWYTLSATLGNAEAQNELGSCYSVGWGGLAKDYDKANMWFRRSAEQGFATAQYNLGFAYNHGDGFVVDYAEAARWYSKAACQGHGMAQFFLGSLYDKGLGVTQNYAEAFRWYRLAAEQGNANAQNNLAVAYEDGNGVTRNMQEAVRWYRMSAAQGCEKAKKALRRLGEW